MSTNNYQYQKLRGLKRKAEYILSRGGKCEICGYNKNITALEFHHKNPKEKKFQIDVRKFANCNLDTLTEELNKCMILCANCHRELHHPNLKIDEILKLEYVKNERKSFNKEYKGTICPVCGTKFKKVTGKIFCSKECRQRSKEYPTKIEVEFQYSLLKSWQKVAEYFGLTRKIIQKIRKS